MAVESFAVPQDLSFEQAIALTQSVLAQALDQQYQGESVESATAAAIRALVSSENGARGFFVTYLSDDRPQAETLLPLVAAALAAAPEIVSPLLVKNLVMATAMAIVHRRHQNADLAAGSDRVRLRTAQLLQQLQFEQLRQQAHQLATSLQTGTGSYQGFLDRWGYDAEQRQAMRQALEQVGLISASHE